jgi:hypothetical protein
MSFTLLGLPREIRDSIYDAVFCAIGEDIKFHEGSLEFTVSYGRERLGSGVVVVDEDDGPDDNTPKNDLEEEDDVKEELAKEAKNEDEEEEEEEEKEGKEEEEEDGETEDEESDCGYSKVEVENETLGDTSQESVPQQDPFEYMYNSAQGAYGESDTQGDSTTDWETEPSIPDISDYSDSHSLPLSRIGPDHRWMLASKQVLSEAVEQFYRHAHCKTYHNVNWHTKYNPYSVRREIHIEKSKEDQLQHPISVFSIAKIMSISLSLRLSHNIKDHNGKKYAAVIPRRSEREDELSSDDDMRDILAHVKSLGPLMLQKLELRVWMYEMEKEYNDSEDSFVDGYRENSYPSNLPGCERVDGYEIDLSFLEALGKQFKQIEIYLHPTYTHTNAKDGLQGSLVVMPMLQHELARMTKKLVGNDWELKDKCNVGCLAPHWRLDVKRGMADQRDGVQRLGSLEHTGLKAWEGTNSEGDDEIFLLQDDRGDSFARWKGDHSDEVVEVRKPMIQEEYGECVFQRSSARVEEQI